MWENKRFFGREMEVSCRREWKQIKGGALMKQKTVQTCSNCGSQNIGEGEFVGYAQIRKKETMFTSSPVDAYICTDCGNILSLKVRHYEKFKQKPLWLLSSGFIRVVNKSNILHIYEYASDKEMKTYTVHSSLYDT